MLALRILSVSSNKNKKRLKLSCSFLFKYCRIILRNIAGFIGSNRYKTFIGLSNELFDHNRACNPENLVLNSWTGILSVSSHLSKVFLQNFVHSIYSKLKKFHKIFLVCGMPRQRDIVRSTEKNSFDQRSQIFFFSAVCLALPASMQAYITLPLFMKLIKSFAANVASLW